jgi:hypothetical protein
VAARVLKGRRCSPQAGWLPTPGAAGERLILPAEVIGILDRLRALGTSERMVRIERDVWIMVAALSPQRSGIPMTRGSPSSPRPRQPGTHTLI